MVRREAERHGCTIVSSEIVGLVPRKALEMAAAWYLQLDPHDSSRVLEDRLEEAANADESRGIIEQADPTRAQGEGAGKTSVGDLIR
jgi:hypothetical protein